MDPLLILVITVVSIEIILGSIYLVNRFTTKNRDLVSWPTSPIICLAHLCDRAGHDQYQGFCSFHRPIGIPLQEGECLFNSCTRIGNVDYQGYCILHRPICGYYGCSQTQQHSTPQCVYR